MSIKNTQRVLLFGATAGIGREVSNKLINDGWNVVAVSRHFVEDIDSQVKWIIGSLPHFESQHEFYDAVVSCGPLDLFSQWLAASKVITRSVVAFGSTSIHVKQNSNDAAEKLIASRLLESEERLRLIAFSRNVPIIVLRPTLVYGSGSDRNISRIAEIACKFNFFLLPDDAKGLRQPVHVEDLALVTLAAIKRVKEGLRCYDLPGGETLTYIEMTKRVLANANGKPRLLLAPSLIFRTISLIAKLMRVHDAGDSILQRLRMDLVFDSSDARSELDYSPRQFEP